MMRFYVVLFVYALGVIPAMRYLYRSDQRHDEVDAVIGGVLWPMMLLVGGVLMGVVPAIHWLLTYKNTEMKEL